MRISLIWKSSYHGATIFEAYFDRDKAELEYKRLAAEDRDQQYTWSMTTISTQDDPK